MTLSFALASEAETRAVAEAIAPHLRPGDFLPLSGPLGAGKTAFARALIQERLRSLGRWEEVPSPSYTIVQIYDVGGYDLWHVDLYRLGDASELAELGLVDALGEAVTVVEWPDRLGNLRPRRSLAFSFDLQAAGSDQRILHVAPEGEGWESVLEALATCSRRFGAFTSRG